MKSVLLAILPFAIACGSSPTQPGEDPFSFVVQAMGTPSIDRSSGEVVPDIDTHVIDGTLIIEGDLVTPCASQPIEGEGQEDRSASLFVLNIGISPPPTCATLPGWYSYVAKWTTVSSGEYTVQVVQPEPPSWEPKLVYSSKILVP